MAKRQRRGHGEGTLEKRGRTWRARWTVDGKTFTKSTGTHDRREAEKILAELVHPTQTRNEIARLENVAARLEGRKAELRRWEESRPALALADGFAAYRRSYSREDSSARTLDGYERMYRQFTRWAAEKHPEETEMRHVTRADAEEYAAHLFAKRSAGTFNKHLTFLRCMWRTLADEDCGARIGDNPWARIKKRRHVVHARRGLTVDELMRVCAAAEGEMRLLIALGIYTGLRLGDCATLEWGAVDLGRGIITKRPRKTARTSGAAVAVPIHRALFPMLAQTPPNRRIGQVLPQTAKEYLKDGNLVTDKVQRLFNECGIKTTTTDEKTGRAMVDVGFHSLRHTFVSMQGNAGVSLAVVQSMVGHVSKEMTQRYFHADAQTLENAVSALPDLTATDAGAGAAMAAERRFRAFLAIAETMTEAERRRAAEWLAGRE